MSRELGPVPTWAKVTTLLLSLAGLGIAVYLTIAHFEGASILVCPGNPNSTIDCAAVTTSPQSYFLHIPVAILGLAQYTAMTALNSPWAWRSTWYSLHVARLALAVVGLAFVLWLLAAELLIIDHICLWCTGVHVVTLALLLVLTSVAPAQLGWARGGAGSAARAR